MERNKKPNYWIILIALALLTAGGYYSFLRDQKARNSGVYAIAKIERIQVAKSGWRVWMEIHHENINFHEDAVYFYEYFSLKSVGNMYFVKVNYNQSDKSLTSIRLIPVLQVPDSIKSPPPEGWSEEWMIAHYPEVVEYVHDTR